MTKSEKPKNFLSLMASQFSDRVIKEVHLFREDLRRIHRDDLHADEELVSQIGRGFNKYSSPYIKVLSKPYRKVQQRLQKQKTKSDDRG